MRKKTLVSNLRHHRLAALLSLGVLVLSVSVVVLVSKQQLVPFSSSHPTTVFLILMENHNWTGGSVPAIKGSASAPYINKTLLPQASYTNQYFNPPGIHPSEPNYLWLEAGDNFGIKDDSYPATDHQSTTKHLTTLLTKAGLSWKSYQENISGTDCPVDNTNLYGVRHNPMVYFDDVINNPSYCVAHVRPYRELASDLQNNRVANYNFITPNVCDDMHDESGCASSDSIQNGDNWLAANVPTILHSQAYKTGGVLFLTWDEGAGNDGPIPMIVLSPLAKGHGYNNNIHYTHSATLRTIQKIFGLSPFLGDAAHSNDLSDLFAVPLTGGGNISAGGQAQVAHQSITTIPFHRRKTCMHVAV